MGLRMLREEAVHAGLKPVFSIRDAAGIVSEILKTTDKQEIRRIKLAWLGIKTTRHEGG